MNRVHEFVAWGLLNQMILWVMTAFHAWVSTGLLVKYVKFDLRTQRVWLWKGQRSWNIIFVCNCYLLDLSQTFEVAAHISNPLQATNSPGLTQHLHQFPDFVWTFKKYAEWRHMQICHKEITVVYFHPLFASHPFTLLPSLHGSIQGRIQYLIRGEGAQNTVCLFLTAAPASKVAQVPKKLW